MRTLSAVFALLFAAVVEAAEIPAIAYHDIVDAPNGDPYAITLADFERQMAYLARRGYEPISLKRLDAVRAGRAVLPPKPVLLTFDDGLRSYYTHAYPVLKRYGFPSILSVVTAWVDGRSHPDGYRAPLLGWEELRTLSRSPLVEIVSHTDDLHHGVPGNPWNSLLPAPTARIYAGGAYESEAERRERIRKDLERSVARLSAELDIHPAGIAWPYGQYDGILVEEAAAHGMLYHLTLDGEPNRVASLPRINRITFRRYRALYDFGDALTAKAHRRRQMRFVQIDLDAFAGKDRNEQRQLVSRLLERLQLLRANAVVLTPFTADGRRAFFPNSVLPVETDLLSYVAHQMVSRAGVYAVYVRLPPSVEAPPALLAELGRYNRFSGLIVGGDEPGRLEEVRAALAPYAPALKLVTTNEELDAGADYRLVSIPVLGTPETVARLAREPRSGRQDLLVLLDATANPSAKTLQAQMRALRAAGIRHYGYGPDDFLGGRPDARVVAVPLNEHTILPGY